MAEVLAPSCTWWERRRASSGPRVRWSWPATSDGRRQSTPAIKHPSHEPVLKALTRRQRLDLSLW